MPPPDTNAPTVEPLQPVFDHLLALTGEFGLYEHAIYSQPRPSHGYTTDDNARALVVVCRGSVAGFDDIDLGPYLEFVLAGEVPGGWRNRMSESGNWTELRGSDDCHGRAIWGLGETVLAGVTDDRVVEAMCSTVTSFDSTYPRSLAYAAFGAAAARQAGVLGDLMKDFLIKASKRLPRPETTPWAWPEPRLTYDNARVPEALIVTGAALDDVDMVESGLRLLSWLIGRETGVGRFSFTPVAGRGETDRGPSFDQQPLEAWAMADACYAAHRVEPHVGWAHSVELAAEWFTGTNDGEAAMYEPETGAGFDGLEEGGANQNQGAESTLAALGTLIRRAQLRRAVSG